MLEEDGRIDEQIFNEYASLNLRYPPLFFHASTLDEAMRFVNEGNIDLVIEMLHVGDNSTFELANMVKAGFPDLPVVLLTPFSREVSLRLQAFDLTCFDYVFCWLGNTDLLVAIVKLLEDKLNAPIDVELVGVQVILLVEDSVRYTSGYLPILYKIIFNQARDFMKEGLNEHQKMVRMRGRPKILLATNFAEGYALYQRYKHNIIGVISDVSYKKSPVARDTDEKLGLKLCGLIREDDFFLPVLLQSSNRNYQVQAKELAAGFLHKYSKNLYHELKEYIRSQFAFGPFLFRHPLTAEVIGQADDLMQLQERILEMPDEVLEYHSLRNDFSKWLNARALFSLARVFKATDRHDFGPMAELRKYLHDAIDHFRTLKARGVIAEFDPERFDTHLLFTRTGGGSIGGKARGIAFADFVINQHNLYSRFENINIRVPYTVAIGVEAFDDFMDENNLHPFIREAPADADILEHFVRQPLPTYLLPVINSFVSCIGRPIAVRSSSKLEDSYYQPFAGVYSTYMVPMGDMEVVAGMVATAIKSIYASVFFKGSRAYLASTTNIIDEEKMGIILQEVCGEVHDNLFYPTCSGVARSVNYYPIGNEQTDDGVVSIAFGLGKTVMDGSQCLRYCPAYPRHVLQLSSPQLALRETQKTFYALSLDASDFKASIDEAVNFRRIKVADIPPVPVNSRLVLSWYDYNNQALSQHRTAESRNIVSFQGLLGHDTIPLNAALRELMAVISAEMKKPVEMEWACQLWENGEGADLKVLQVRPIVSNELATEVIALAGRLPVIFTPKGLGNGVINPVTDIIMVNLDNYRASNNSIIAEIIEKLNDRCRAEQRNYMLVGPGRWGSSDPWLGIPVRWATITQARVVVEQALENYQIDPSQGTHFFMNLTSFQAFYFTINSFAGKGWVDWSRLPDSEVVYHDEFVKWLRPVRPLVAVCDGKTGKGEVLV